MVVLLVFAAPARAELRVTAYYPGYRQSYLPPESIDFSAVTHTIHFSLMPNADGSLNMALAYVDEITFANSLLIILSHSTIYAEVEFLPTIEAHGMARRDLARDAERAIANALNLTVGYKEAVLLA